MRKMILDCEKCGGTLEVTEEMDLFKCEFCGMPYMVELSDGGMRVTRLEARVARVEDEQERVRLDLLASRLLEVRSKIESVYDDLSAVEVDKANQLFKEGSAERLYREELELRQEYIKQGGDDPELLRYVNLLTVIADLRSLFPKWNLGVWFDKERTPIFKSWYYCPAVRHKGFVSTMFNADPIVSVYRQKDEIKVRNVGLGNKKRVVSLLQAKYPDRVVK